MRHPEARRFYQPREGSRVGCPRPCPPTESASPAICDTRPSRTPATRAARARKSFRLPAERRSRARRTSCPEPAASCSRPADGIPSARPCREWSTCCTGSGRPARPSPPADTLPAPASPRPFPSRGRSSGSQKFPGKRSSADCFVLAAEPQTYRESITREQSGTGYPSLPRSLRQRACPERSRRVGILTLAYTEKNWIPKRIEACGIPPFAKHAKDGAPGRL